MLTAVLLLFINIRIISVKKEWKEPRLLTYIESCCIWMLLLYAATELLSVFHLVRFLPLVAVWGGVDAALLATLFWQVKMSGCRIQDLLRQIIGFRGRRLHAYNAVLAVIGFTVCLLALITVPYNWDSMTYHLPRIMHWTQNRSVAHYATNSLRQIASPVLGEFVNLHVYILSRHTDLLFNMLQAVSYLICAYMVGAISDVLGCDRVSRFMGVLLYMTMPIAFGEALTTQVDNFATVWLLYFVYILLDLIKQPTKLNADIGTVRKVCMMGLCVAWGYLAKPSVCIAMVIFAIWLLLRCCVRRDSLKDLFCLFLSALPCVVLPIFPKIYRNFKTFHSYSSEIAGARQLVGTLDPAYLFVNFLKNFTFNLPTALVWQGNRMLESMVAKAADIFNVDLNAESISENGLQFTLHEANTYGHDTAVNPLIVWLFLFCLVWTIFTFRRIDRKNICFGYFLTSAVSFCAFCTCLRWEPFVSRYMVSYLALLCPMICSQIHLRTLASRKLVFRFSVIGIVCFLCCMEFFNLTRYHYNICVGQGHGRRPLGYFTAQGEELYYCGKITDEIRSNMYDTVGLMFGESDWEYPIWKMLSGQRLEHVNVTNESARYSLQDYTPDCIILIGALPDTPITVNDTTYSHLQDFGGDHYLLTP